MLDRAAGTPLARARRAGAAAEVAMVRWTGTSVGGLVARTPVLVVHSTGRRSGRARRTPVAAHLEPAGTWLVVGGAGGQARIPDWVANLRATPEAEITVHRQRVAVRAVELTGAERAEVWVHLSTVWPRIDVYERRAGRPVPVLRLLPR